MVVNEGGNSLLSRSYALDNHGKSMSAAWEADSLMSDHSRNIDRYKLNFLQQVICELRFPTLMELGESRPPAQLVAALRKEYPHLDLANEVTLGIAGGLPGSNNAHLFRSAKLNWTVTVRQSAISLETTAYPGFPQMKERILHVIEAASKIIDSDFFTRVGLRYINVVDGGEDPREGWINPELIQPLMSRKFTGIQEYAGKLSLSAEDGGCLFQHGIKLKPARKDGTPASPDYLLDIDAFRNEVRVEDAEMAINSLHAQAFDFFDWAIGEKARDYLSRDKD